MVLDGELWAAVVQWWCWNGRRSAVDGVGAVAGGSAVNGVGC